MRAKKSLGQNFLKSRAVLNEIIKAADLKPEDLVLEVGPGKGALTEALLRSARHVIAVEKDDLLVEYLREKFAPEIKNGRLELIHCDILALEPAKILKNSEPNYKIVANIPYYITGAFVRKFLSGNAQPSSMVLLLQKEVAKRIVAADKESLLSISVKAYGRPRYVKKVPARFFAPAPKVDSAILAIENISRDFFTKNKIDEEEFFALLHAGFAHKRKFLISNLKAAPLRGAANWSEKFQQCKISEKVRAEDLSLENWKSLVSTSLFNSD